MLGSEDIIGADIAIEYRADGLIDEAKPRSVLENLTPINKPASLLHYEWAYANVIKEFGYEKNTGLITSQEFFAHGATNRPPVIIWPGISDSDMHEIINKKIGTKLIFTNLHVPAFSVLYLYYNSFNDMLRIKREDVENSIDGFYKVENLKTNDLTLQAAIIKGEIE